jgi:hypothetical protein
MFNLNALISSVGVDAASGRPREIRTHGGHFPVTRVESVRDETAAYPLESGPRTVFVVATVAGRFRLVYLLRHRRWVVEELRLSSSNLSDAA